MSAHDPKLLGWMRLGRSRILRPRDLDAVAEALGDVATLESGRPRATDFLEGLAPGLTASLRSRPLGRQVRDELAAVEALGWTTVHREDPLYPPALLDMTLAPAVLHIRGDLDALAEPAVAFVGSRTPTRYGLNVTRQLAGDLARRGLVIVSGLARGIDTAAHQAALEVGGRTVAVMATGPDEVYPTRNGRLALEIAASGALVTEMPPRTPPLRHHFPKRNRIIAGLSLAVVVVEAAERSGSLLTARWALEEGRGVLAVPGRITEPTSRGTLALIRDGAPLACEARDVLEEIPEPARSVLLGLELEPEDGPDGPGAPALPGGLDEGCRPVLAALSFDEDRPLDDLLEELEMAPSQVLASLFALELAGLVQAHPGQRYSRSRR